jgi:hypothetical protein
MSDSPIPEQSTHGLETLDKLTRFASEDLARGLNRRSFMRRAGTGAFAFMITLTTGKLFTPRSAAAAAIGPKPPEPAPLISCSPPGPYCNTGGGSLTGCHGAHCFQHLYNGTIYQCQVYYQYYSAGCWTTAASGGYWTCCDCSCGTPRVATCGCAQFSGTPAPSPDRPVG